MFEIVCAVKSPPFISPSQHGFVYYIKTTKEEERYIYMPLI